MLCLPYLLSSAQPGEAKSPLLLRYAEQREWSRLVTIPESGILITPEQGEVFSYLLRYRQLN